MHFPWGQVKGFGITAITATPDAVFIGFTFNSLLIILLWLTYFKILWFPGMNAILCFEHDFLITSIISLLLGFCRLSNSRAISLQTCSYVVGFRNWGSCTVWLLGWSND